MKALFIILAFTFSSLLSFQKVDQKVYITSTGKRYHHENCRYLKYSKIEISLKEAREAGYTPCKVCFQSTVDSVSSNTQNKKDIPNTYHKRCQAITQKGTQCKRMASPGSNYCWQHQRQ